MASSHTPGIYTETSGSPDSAVSPPQDTRGNVQQFGMGTPDQMNAFPSTYAKYRSETDNTSPESLPRKDIGTPGAEKDSLRGPQEKSTEHKSSSEIDGRVPNDPHHSLFIRPSSGVRSRQCSTAGIASGRRSTAG